MTTRLETTPFARLRMSLPKVAVWVGGIVFVLLAVIAWRMQWLGAGRTVSPAGIPAAAEAGAEDVAERRSHVELSEQQAEFAGLRESVVARRRIRETRTVPGRVNYDGARHLEITSPVDCVVREVLVEPGRQVAEGEPLVVLSSAEVGRARDDVMRREADVELARKEHEWAEQIFENVEQLLANLSVHPSLADVERQLESRPLGEYREKLVAAYSKLLLAESVTISTNELEKQGTISRRTIEERRSNREIAAATFKGACESARFEAMRGHVKAHAQEQQAERLLAISRDNLASLLGPQGTVVELAAPPASAGSESTDPHATPREREQRMSEFHVRAPFSGRIEERHVVAAARVAAGKPLFTLANTKTLWVEAEIHERDWSALEFSADGSITIRVPALNDAEFATALRFVGARVSPETRSVPLVVELANDQGRFKPGLFVWVDVPLEPEREALVVPAGAIMRHDDQAFVFVPDGPRRYRRVDVKTGLESSHGVEILAGLAAGTQVVDHGAFFLKSELLLDKEE